MTAKRMTLAVVAAGLVIGLAGCGADKANEQAVENAIESANPSVSADVKDGGAGITATDKDGNSIGVGSAAKVPADFPSAVPLPEGTLQSAAAGKEGKFVLIYKVSTSPADAAAAYTVQLKNAGFTIDSSGGASAIGGVTAKGKGYEVTGFGIGSGGSTGFTVSVQPK